MINHGISLSNRTNYYLNDEFVNVKCTTKDYYGIPNQYKYPTVCPTDDYNVAGFPLVNLLLTDDEHQLSFESIDYFLFPVS